MLAGCEPTRHSVVSGRIRRTKPGHRCRDGRDRPATAKRVDDASHHTGVRLNASTIGRSTSGRAHEQGPTDHRIRFRSAIFLDTGLDLLEPRVHPGPAGSDDSMAVAG